jgi:hypothetical protein
MTTNEKAGLALILASAVVAVAMTFHPTGRDVIDSAAGGGGNIRDVAVHIIAIVAEVTLLLGTLALTARLAGQRDLAVSAFVVFAVAMMCLIIAAAASGLIAPGVASHMVGTEGPERDMLMAVFRYNGHVNQAFAKLGFGLAAMAIVLWSTAMARDGLSRGLGWYGILVGVSMIAGLLFVRSRFMLHGMGGLVMAGQLAWLIAAGVVLRRPALR